MNSIQNKIESKLSEKVISVNSLGGGCIGNALKVITESGNKYFVKHYANNKMHSAEANGLLELCKTNSIRIPINIKDLGVQMSLLTNHSRFNNIVNLQIPMDGTYCKYLWVSWMPSQTIQLLVLITIILLFFNYVLHLV